ncbi:MAG: LytTR family transcriptional regulator [Bacteroidales bacterium]|nr:LytTR family transcriptional regulator [Bacteroidales bacterium]
MKKVFIIVAYWLVAIFLTGVLLTSLDYDLGQAILMSLSFLPAAMALAFLLPKVEQTKNKKKQLADTICIILGVMMMTFLLIYLWQFIFITFIYGEDYSKWTLPAMLGNPVFVAAILAILAYGNYLLVKWLDRKYPTDYPVTFTSDYKKITLKKEDILYVESRDSEVWIFARDGQSYRNKTGISQWENLLGPGFLRVHRAFLVNLTDATLTAPDVITVAGQSIPVSRKYKDTVKSILPATFIFPEQI